MFQKLAALMEVMRYGQEVADPAKWKGRQVKANALAGMLLALGALAKTSGIEIPVNEEVAMGLASGVLAIFNAIMTVISSKKIGLGKE